MFALINTSKTWFNCVHTRSSF